MLEICRFYGNYEELIKMWNTQVITKLELEERRCCTMSRMTSVRWWISVCWKPNTVCSRMRSWTAHGLVCIGPNGWICPPIH